MVVVNSDLLQKLKRQEKKKKLEAKKQKKKREERNGWCDVPLPCSFRQNNKTYPIKKSSTS
jgi:hypothetical protein